MANTNKIKPFITPDWTQGDGRSKPFYQPASGSLEERYSVTVLSEYATTGGSERQARMNLCVEPGLNRILRYYSKVSRGSVVASARAEEYYISERPNAKMKVLVSLPCNALDTLPDKKISRGSGKISHEIRLSTSDMKNKLDIAGRFIIKYGEEIEKFHGKVYGYDYNKESSKLLGFMPAITKLLQDNDVTLSSTDSFLITLLCDYLYQVRYISINRGAGSIPLSKGYDNFIDNPPSVLIFLNAAIISPTSVLPQNEYNFLI